MSDISKQLEGIPTEKLEAYIKSKETEKKALKAKKKEAYEDLKQDVIVGLSVTAENLNETLKAFKIKAFQEMQTLYVLLQEYSERHADGKGSFKIENDHYKVSYTKQGKPSFDERANQAEKHIIDFLDTKFYGDKDTKDLILSLLERKNGDLDVNLVQKLYKMEDRFDNENWQKGISLLKESYNYCFSKDYIRFDKKMTDGSWEPISLQFSKISIK